jgi:drug/metabolite transporter (DMT)-like permease
MAGGLVAVCLWGLAPVATRAAVEHLAPVPLLVLRLGLASLVLLPWAVPVFRRLRPRAAGRLLAAGTLGFVGYNLPVTVGLQWLPASTAGLLLATEPVWVMLIGWAFLAERVGTRAWLGSAAALGGVAALAGPGAVTGAVAGAHGYRTLAGAGLVLAGTLAFGAYTIVLRPLSQSFGAVPATAASTVVGTLPYLPFAGTLAGARLADLGPAVWAALAFLAIGSSVAGMLLWNLAVLSGGTAPRQRAAVPGARGERGRSGDLARRAYRPAHDRRRAADPGRRGPCQHRAVYQARSRFSGLKRMYCLGRGNRAS